jgi:very-short-patch-repair endonuclease
LDGGVHDLRIDDDARRDAWLTANGWTVLRFRNQAVLNNPSMLFQAVREHAEQCGKG